MSLNHIGYTRGTFVTNLLICTGGEVHVYMHPICCHEANNEIDT